MVNNEQFKDNLLVRVDKLEKDIHVDPLDDDKVVINDGLTVDKDGDVDVGKNLTVDGKIIIGAATDIVDEDGDKIQFGNDQISSAGAQAGQFLVANGSGGATWATVPSANGQSF